MASPTGIDLGHECFVCDREVGRENLIKDGLRAGECVDVKGCERALALKNTCGAIGQRTCIACEGQFDLPDMDGEICSACADEACEISARCDGNVTAADFGYGPYGCRVVDLN